MHRRKIEVSRLPAFCSRSLGFDAKDEQATRAMSAPPQAAVLTADGARDALEPDSSPYSLAGYPTVSDWQDGEGTAERFRVDDALQLISTCKRCKRRRKKCDARLPSCASCEKAEVECTFYDHWLGQELPRRYAQQAENGVQSLTTAVMSTHCTSD